MWRLVITASMLLTFALGGIAHASPRIVIESVVVDRDGASTKLRFTARSVADSAFPETGTAVVMQVDGNRSKCLTVSLMRTEMGDGVATYVGTFNRIYGDSSFTGRVDVGGFIHDFSVPVDGSPGTIEMSTDQSSVAGAAAVPQVIRPQPVVITPDPASRDPRRAAAAAPESQPAAQAVAEPAPAAESAPALVDSLRTQPVAWLGLIVIVSAAVGAYLDRKRALQRAASAA